MRARRSSGVFKGADQRAVSKTAGRPEGGGDTAAARIKGSSRESAGDGTCEEGGMWINKRLRLNSALAWSPKNVGLR